MIQNIMMWLFKLIRKQAIAANAVYMSSRSVREPVLAWKNVGPSPGQRYLQSK